MLSPGDIILLQKHKKFKSEKIEHSHHTNIYHKRTCGVTLISGETDLKTSIVTRAKKRYCIMKEVSASEIYNNYKST